MKKLPYKATIDNGSTRIERRVYEDDEYMQCVKINGMFFRLTDLEKSYDVWQYYDPEPIR